MALLDIPVDNVDPAFSFLIDLDGRTYEFSFRWNGRIETWIFDIYDDTQTAIQLGVPFHTNQIFLEDNPSPDKPPGNLMAVNSAAEGVDADRFSLGVDVKFLYDEVV